MGVSKPLRTVRHIVGRELLNESRRRVYYNGRVLVRLYVFLAQSRSSPQLLLVDLSSARPRPGINETWTCMHAERIGR
jgi:hypothetical protein